MSIGENLILVDEQTEYNITRNPIDTKGIINDFSLFKFGDKKLKGYLVKSKNDKLIPLEEYEKCCHLVESGLYNNVYYPLEEFNEYYKRDYRILLKRISFMIGAKNVFLSYSDEEEYNKEEKDSYNIEAKAQVPVFKAEANVNTNSKNSSKDYIKTELYDKISMSKKEVSKEKFEEWLKTENINIRAFDEIIGDCINRFLDDGKIDFANINRKDVKIKHNISSRDKRINISAGFEYAPTFITGKFNYDMDRFGSSEIKIAEMVKVKIEF